MTTTALPAFAQELTPAQALALIEQAAVSMNVDFKLRNQRVEGDAIVADGFKYTADEEVGLFTFTGGPIALRPSADDYDVEIDWPEQSSIRIDSREGELESLTFGVEMLGTDYRFRIADGAQRDADGVPELIDYTFDVESFAMTLLEFEEAVGEDPVDFDLNVLLSELGSVGTWAADGDQSMSGSIGSMVTEFFVDAVDGRSRSSSRSEGLSFALDTAGPLIRGETETIGPDDVLRFSFSSSGSQGSAEFGGPDGNFSYQTSSGGTAFAVGVGDGRFDFEAGASALNADIAFDMLPVPGAAFAVEEMSLDISGPILPSDEAQAASLSLGLERLTVSDTLWGLFDPQAVLPRDPATLIAEISAEIDLQEDLGGMMEMDQPPFMPRSIQIERLEADAVGAALMASGAFDFIVDGFEPIPVGKATVEVSGINQLMENLTQIGVITSSDLLPVRMMLGVFMQPNGDDSYFTEIEAAADGLISANGVPFQ
ncbi:DUF2125 domain-containing protein [Pontivivens insulae]|nr:DUF2125 domain-containing protein [Pontivivens insulae]